MTKHEQVLDCRNQIELLTKHVELAEDMIERLYHKMDQLTEEIQNERNIHNA